MGVDRKFGRKPVEREILKLVLTIEIYTSHN